MVLWVKQKGHNFLYGMLEDRKNCAHFGAVTPGKVINSQMNIANIHRVCFRCTDGIVFVLDSVDVERMEEAKMELMRTAKCPDNQVKY